MSCRPEVVASSKRKASSSDSDGEPLETALKKSRVQKDAPTDPSRMYFSFFLRFLLLTNFSFSIGRRVLSSLSPLTISSDSEMEIDGPKPCPPSKTPVSAPIPSTADDKTLTSGDNSSDDADGDEDNEEDELIPSEGPPADNLRPRPTRPSARLAAEGSTTGTSTPVVLNKKGKPWGPNRRGPAFRSNSHLPQNLDRRGKTDAFRAAHVANAIPQLYPAAPLLNMSAILGFGTHPTLVSSAFSFLFLIFIFLLSAFVFLFSLCSS